MNCIIDNSIRYYLTKGKKEEVVRRYIKLKYRINMDIAALKKRAKQMNLNMELS